MFTYVAIAMNCDKMGRFLLMLYPDIIQFVRITWGVVRGMSVAKFLARYPQS